MYSNEAFEKLPPEKKEKIVQAGMECFAEKGYEGASTNEIVKRAGISKGILFHYFGNKKNFYLYILNKVMETMVEKICTGYRDAPPDLFERLMFKGMLKLRLSLEEPLLYRMIYVTFVNTPEDLKEEAQQWYNRLYGMAIPMLLDGLDLSKVRSGVDPNKAIETVLLFMEGLQAKYMEAYKKIPADQALSTMDQLLKESRVYMDILKKGVYGS
jgi:AcrR family transcriptional regulator